MTTLIPNPGEMDGKNGSTEAVQIPSQDPTVLGPVAKPVHHGCSVGPIHSPTKGTEDGAGVA